MLKITMRTDTAAMEEWPSGAVAEALRDVAGRIAVDNFRAENVNLIRDANGARIGEWIWTEKGE